MIRIILYIAISAVIVNFGRFLNENDNTKIKIKIIDNETENR